MIDFIVNKLNKYYYAHVRQVEGEPRTNCFRSKTAARLLTSALLLGGGVAGFTEACVLKNNFWHHEMSAALSQAHLVKPDSASVANAEIVLVSFKNVQNPSSAKLEAVREAKETIMREEDYRKGYERIRAQVHEEPDPLPISILASASIITFSAAMIPLSLIAKEREEKKAHP